MVTADRSYHVPPWTAEAAEMPLGPSSPFPITGWGFTGLLHSWACGAVWLHRGWAVPNVACRRPSLHSALGFSQPLDLWEFQFGAFLVSERFKKEAFNSSASLSASTNRRGDGMRVGATVVHMVTAVISWIRGMWFSQEMPHTPMSSFSLTCHGNYRWCLSPNPPALWQ